MIGLYSIFYRDKISKKQPMINTSLDLVPPIRGLESFSYCSVTFICNGGWMMFVCISRASFLFRS